MNHGDTGDTEGHGHWGERGGGARSHAAKGQANSVSGEVVAGAIRVHSRLRPGLLESAYERCLAIELASRGLECKRQVALPITYLGTRLDDCYRVDLLVEDLVIVELKAVEQLDAIHEAHLLTYLRLSGRWLGLLINFHVPLLRQGIRRLVNG